MSGSTQKIRLGVIGLGNMGSAHCKWVSELPAFALSAVCDSDAQRLSKVTERYQVPGYTDVPALLAANVCEAILIATPHFSHTPIGIAALQHGYHVLMEKPLSVHKADVEKLLRAHKNDAQVFAAMFNQRTNPAYATMRRMLLEGELGAVRRIQWTITDWFRSQAYYDSGGWRATWAGEGGGVLLNQCPHQLDLLQWMFGMPAKVQAFCAFGKHHDIEVEDEVVAHLTYANGACGVFITSTGEAPGINRLEVATEMGLLSYDTNDGFISWQRNEKSVSAAIAENAGFEKPALESCKLRIRGQGTQHRGILKNFAAAIRGKETLIAPAEEGIHSVELANAMLYSSWCNKAIALPMSSRAYANQLSLRIANSRAKPDVVTDAADLSSSF